MNHSIIENVAHLRSDYIPSEFPHREAEQEQLKSVLSTVSSAGSSVLFVTGPRGSGKTHTIRSLLNHSSDRDVTCYIPCHEHDTQYKVLKQMCHRISNEKPADGHHTGSLQQMIEERTRAIDTLVVLDELEFALQKDGDDLLYFLSRLDTQPTLILVSATVENLADALEERTYSSLHPKRLRFEQYTAEERYDILAARARRALTSQSLHRQALTHIASSVQNLTIGVHWLRTAAKAADDIITEHITRNVREQAYRTYVNELVNPFSDHHELLYQAIEQLWTDHGTQLLTGDIYTQYQHYCETHETEPLTNRRISDFLTHLEYLNLIEADYHYGGQKGKTREIYPPENISINH